MPRNVLVFIVLIVLLIAVLPSWPYSASWGYAPTGVLSTVLIIVLILVLLGMLDRGRPAAAHTRSDTSPRASRLWAFLLSTWRTQ